MAVTATAAAEEDMAVAVAAMVVMSDGAARIVAGAARTVAGAVHPAAGNVPPWQMIFCTCRAAVNSRAHRAGKYRLSYVDRLVFSLEGPGKI